MTTITMQLPDEIFQQAKKAGVLNEQALAELFGQFLQTHIKNSNMPPVHANSNQAWDDFFNDSSLKLSDDFQRGGQIASKREAL